MDQAPVPTVMPVDREKWKRELGISNFINAYYKYRDLQLCGQAKTVLLVGPGQGLALNVLKWRGYQVTTYDIDSTFSPDFVGSVHDLSRFSSGQFDVVIASHVLEHLAISYLDTALAEIARVSRYAMIYLPVAGRHLQARLEGIRGLEGSWVLDIFNFFETPDGVTAKYCGGQHFWEIGLRGFRIKDVARRLSRFFDILFAYRNQDWNRSYNFVLKSRR